MDIHDWNSRLVAAVFHDRVDLSPEIRRINATDSFLAEAGGFEDGACARASFVGVMPRTESGVRGLFDAGVMRRWTPHADDLPFYAQLHLTILAASAEESLQDQGNFRVRLAQMLGLEPKDYVSGGCLPALWENAVRWSLNRAERRGDTRRLALPDPGAETIIGYSKRLAFPGFRDQNRLAELFTHAGIDESSPLSHFMAVFHSQLGGFSDRFREEFDRFARLLEVGDRETALDTAFWDAVVETTWARVRRSGHVANAGCRLEIDPTDPYDPGLWLYCQEEGDGGSGWTKMPEDRLGNSLVGWRRDADCSPGKLFDLLRSWLRAGQQRALLGDRLGRALGEGCVGFVKDDEGRWFDTLSLPESGSLWLVLHRDNGWLLEAPTGSDRDVTVYRAPLVGSSAWTLFGPIDVDDATRGWFEAHAFTLDFFSPRLVRRRITVVGSIRRPDGAYLFLPPVVPAFRCADARSGVATLEREGVASSHELRLQDDRLLLPETARDGNGQDLAIHVVAFDASGKDLAHGHFQFRDVSSALGFKTVRTPSAWLESGLGGRLQAFSLDPIWQEAAASDRSKRIGRGIRPLSKAHLSSESAVTVEPEDVDTRWTRTTEILSAIFARRYAYPIGECAALLEALWGSRREAWAKLDDLIENGVLHLLHTRHWSSRVVVAGHPVVVVHPHGAGLTLRIVGLLSAAMRAVANRMVGERCCVVASPDRLTSGALECRLDGADDLSALHAETGWPVLWWNELPAFDLPAFEDIFAVHARSDLVGYADDEKIVWSPRPGCFFSEPRATSAIPRLERWRAARQQDLFVLYRTDGTMWNTDCRKWALLALAAERASGIGYALGDGTIRLHDASLALPTPLAWFTVAGGGGVCFREPGGERVYPASGYWSPAAACAGWMGDVGRTTGRPRRRRAAHDRYMFLLERERRARRAC